MACMKWSLSLPIVLLLLTGCEKKIDFKLKDETEKLVVEATIENGEPPRVTLTHSFGYFSNISTGQILQSFVHGAEVYVSNGTLTHRLKEYPVSLGPGISAYYYSIDSSNLATAFNGAPQHSYSLRIVSDGQEYTATTTIPNFNKTIDSVWWQRAPATSDTNRAVILARLTDPPGYGDYVRYFTRINRQPFFLPPINSAFDDLFIDGTSYQVQLQPGVDRNADTTDKNFFFRGDTVQIKLSSIDKATYDFWRTWEFSYASVGNPFSTPSKVLGNISNNALGYFGGYASQYKTVIIPR